MDQTFSLVCSWDQDESGNDHFYGDVSHWSLYIAEPGNSVGYRYIKTLDIGCGGRWISDDEAHKIMNDPRSLESSPPT